MLALLALFYSLFSLLQFHTRYLSLSPSQRNNPLLRSRNSKHSIQHWLCYSINQGIDVRIVSPELLRKYCLIIRLERILKLIKLLEISKEIAEIGIA
jgi:hypothetical protein